MPRKNMVFHAGCVGCLFLFILTLTGCGGGFHHTVENDAKPSELAVVENTADQDSPTEEDAKTAAAQSGAPEQKAAAEPAPEKAAAAPVAEQPTTTAESTTVPSSSSAEAGTSSATESGTSSSAGTAGSAEVAESAGTASAAGAAGTAEATEQAVPESTIENAPGPAAQKSLTNQVEALEETAPSTSAVEKSRAETGPFTYDQTDEKASVSPSSEGYVAPGEMTSEEKAEFAKGDARDKAEAASGSDVPSDIAAPGGAAPGSAAAAATGQTKSGETVQEPQSVTDVSPLEEQGRKAIEEADAALNAAGASSVAAPSVPGQTAPLSQPTVPTVAFLYPEAGPLEDIGEELTDVLENAASNYESRYGESTVKTVGPDIFSDAAVLEAQVKKHLGEGARIFFTVAQGTELQAATTAAEGADVLVFTPDKRAALGKTIVPYDWQQKALARSLSHFLLQQNISHVEPIYSAGSKPALRHFLDVYEVQGGSVGAGVELLPTGNVDSAVKEFALGLKAAVDSKGDKQVAVLLVGFARADAVLQAASAIKELELVRWFGFPVGEGKKLALTSEAAASVAGKTQLQFPAVSMEYNGHDAPTMAISPSDEKVLEELMGLTPQAVARNAWGGLVLAVRVQGAILHGYKGSLPGLFKTKALEAVEFKKPVIQANPAK